MPRRAPSINAPVTAQSNAAGYQMSRANWARQVRSPLPNWKLSVSFWGKTLSASYETEESGGLIGAITSKRLLLDLPSDRLVQKVIR